LLVPGGVTAGSDPLEQLANTTATPPDKAGAAWRMTLTPEHADVETGALPEMVTTWDGVLRHFGLDPVEFAVVDDTVRMSSWQQSKRTESGDRDVVWLYSYKARFKRITNRLPESDVDAAIERIRKRKLTVRRTPGAGLGAPSTVWVGWADWQAHKGSIEELERRCFRSFEQTVERIEDLRRIGRNVSALAVGNMGDPFEGCYGNYDSQLFSVSGTKRQQLNAVLDLWTAGMLALAPLFDDVLFLTVLSNHSEWTRSTAAGSKPVTSDSDNADGFLAESLKRVLTARGDMGHVRWSIPHDQMVTAETLSGVRVGFTHGHKMPGSNKELDWLRAQSIRLLRSDGTEPRLWMTAHRHHLDVRDFGWAHRLQHPTLEVAPSKWYADSTGLWSTPGTLTALIGEHDQAGGPMAGSGIGFSDLAVLPA
jgi:hypothetical protein